MTETFEKCIRRLLRHGAMTKSTTLVQWLLFYCTFITVYLLHRWQALLYSKWSCQAVSAHGFRCTAERSTWGTWPKWCTPGPDEDPVTSEQRLLLVYYDGRCQTMGLYIVKVIFFWEKSTFLEFTWPKYLLRVIKSLITTVRVVSSLWKNDGSCW